MDFVGDSQKDELSFAGDSEDESVRTKTDGEFIERKYYQVVYGTLQVVRKIAECVFCICQQTTPECYWKVHLKYTQSVHGKVCR